MTSSYPRLASSRTEALVIRETTGKAKGALRDGIGYTMKQWIGYARKRGFKNIPIGGKKWLNRNFICPRALTLQANVWAVLNVHFMATIYNVTSRTISKTILIDRKHFLPIIQALHGRFHRRLRKEVIEVFTYPEGSDSGVIWAKFAYSNKRTSFPDGTSSLAPSQALRHWFDGSRSGVIPCGAFCFMAAFQQVQSPGRQLSRSDNLLFRVSAIRVNRKKNTPMLFSSCQD